MSIFQNRNSHSKYISSQLSTWSKFFLVWNFKKAKYVSYFLKQQQHHGNAVAAPGGNWTVDDGRENTEREREHTNQWSP